MRDYQPLGRERIAEILAWIIILLVIAIGLNIYSVVSTRAEPGDRYETSVRRGHLANPTGRVWPTPGAVGGAPYGCPQRKYCGCAVALKVFGRADPKLFLAANWLRFPRSRPAPGMVAARKGHVMLILSHVQGRNYIVYDPNSGGGLTREHVRSITGFKIVNPRIRLAAK